MSISRNAYYNMVGFVVPTLLGLASVPAYIHLIGQERYGVLALGWLILGYFGVFDLGLGRATSQRIAALRDADPGERRKALATSLVSNIGIGLLGAAILLPITLWLFGQSFAMSPALRREAVVAAPLIALALPVATTIGVLSGALMGRELFYRINHISIVSTLFFQLLPLAIAWIFGPKLVWLLAASVFARLVSVAMMWQACRREFGSISLADWDRSQLRQLLSFGGWVVLTGLFSPLLIYTDRFLIGTLIGAAMVTVYTVPMDATRRIAGIPTAITSALFPRLTLADDAEANAITRLAVSVIYALLTAPCIGAMFLMYPLMRLWLGTALGNEVAPLAMIFIVAVWYNAFALLPFSLLQARGRPDLVSKLLLAELPFYLIGVWFAIGHWGIRGAAWALTLRTVIDANALLLFANRSLVAPLLINITFAIMCALAVGLGAWPELQLVPALIYGTGAGLAALAGTALFAPEGIRRVLGMLSGLLRR